MLKQINCRVHICPQLIFDFDSTVDDDARIPSVRIHAVFTQIFSSNSLHRWYRSRKFWV